MRPLTTASDVEILEGLPHPDAESEAFANEAERSDVVVIYGHHYYRDPVSVDREVLKQIQSLCADKSQFRAIHPTAMKACGRYHPDWRVHWTQADHDYALEMCFGCYDAKLYVDRELQLMCEMISDKSFAAVLKPLRANRPESNLTAP